MLKRPQWVKEKIEGKEKQIPLQMTVKKKYLPQPQDSYSEMQTISATNTGAGVDGEIQPGKMVDIQVHEGEGIIPNNAMQGLTEDEFQGLVETLSSGNIDKNKLREAIGMSTVSEYQTGGIAGDTTEETTITRNPLDTLQQSIASTNPTTVATEGQTTTGETATTTGQTTARNALDALQQRAGSTAEQIVEPTVSTEGIKAPEQVTRETNIPTLVPQTITETTTPTEDTTVQETVTTPTTSTAGEAVKIGLQKILAEVEGVTDVDRKIANFYLQNIDASNAANLRLLESQISADPEMSDQAKRAAIAGLQREAAATRSETVGELAVNAAERASAAARDLITYGQDIRQYEEITKPMSDLEMQQLEAELGTANYDLINNLIDRGYSLEKVNTELANQGITPLTQAEYTSILSTGSTGQTNWDRKIALAETLLATPDASGNNIATAAAMFSDLYDGVDIDFSGLLTQQNAATFSQGLSQMATYADMNMDIDAALEAMKADGTLELLGGDEELATKLYAASKVNAIDQEWKEIESSEIYQAMLNSTDTQEKQNAADIKEFYTQSVMGLLDFDTLHEYKITSSAGEALGSVYALNAEDAQAKADEMGAGNTITDTGNVEFTVKEEVEEGEVDTDLKARWEAFKEDVPDDVNATDLYPRWEVWQEENPDGTYEDFLKTETAANKIYTLDVANTEELLTAENSNIVMSAYETDPDAVKEKGYYWEPLTTNDLKGKFETTRGGFFHSGTHTTIDPATKATLESSKGQMTEIPLSDGSTIVGQVQDILYGQSSTEMLIKQLDGTLVQIIVYEAKYNQAGDDELVYWVLK